MTGPQQDHTPYRPELLPAAVDRYLQAHQITRDDAAALATFTPDARVTDDGATHTGTDAIRDWLTNAASEYTYTTTLVGQSSDGPDHWVVLTHLEGDFPGGTVDLRLRFRLEQDHIAELAITP